jgi:hypothetical protein
LPKPHQRNEKLTRSAQGWKPSSFCSTHLPPLCDCSIINMLFSSALFLFAFVSGSSFVEVLAVVLFTPSQTPPTSPTSYPPTSSLVLLGRPGSPLPTTTLSFEAELARKRQNSQFTTNCAYFNNVALTCPTSQYCVYNTIVFAVGCCSLDSSGQNFASDCVVPTECLNQAESSLYCPASGCAADTTVW